MKPCPVCQEPCENSDELHLHLTDDHHWSIEKIEAELGELMLGQNPHSQNTWWLKEE